MDLSDIRAAVRDARQAISDGDYAVRQASGLIVDRLRAASVDVAYLRKLKKELQGFNARTGKWRP